jgi:hypothetical protein
MQESVRQRSSGRTGTVDTERFPHRTPKFGSGDGEVKHFD